MKRVLNILLILVSLGNLILGAAEKTKLQPIGAIYDKNFFSMMPAESTKTLKWDTEKEQWVAVAAQLVAAKETEEKGAELIPKAEKIKAESTGPLVCFPGIKKFFSKASDGTIKSWVWNERKKRWVVAQRVAEKEGKNNLKMN